MVVKKSFKTEFSGRRRTVTRKSGFNVNYQFHGTKLKFDKGGIVTVITKHSCKGLEFDSVFILELQEVDVDPSAIDQFKMEMYVMTSRARSKLFMLLTNQDNSDLQILDYLPKKDKNLLEYING